ncbi:hypothetical protein [Aestuariimicrobium ganziense]|uniref:hypothetical protein n=1 Tax=Aestuariimicrobium ganziense TaxID=2773677 RepID=UPI001945985F|nr:hypothetical protein [Aestuariimicrobium ganziense]
MTGLLPLHGVGSRSDLPLPFALVVFGAALVVVLTFVLVLRSWGRARWTEPRGRALPGLTRLVDHPVTRWALRLLVLAANVVAWVALWAGPDKVSNPFPGFLFVWVWVGLVVVSLLTGTSWSALHPVRTLLAWRAGSSTTTPMPRWGVWPGALALAGFGFLELVQPDRATTGVLRWWALAWLVWVVAGTLRHGGAWLASSDPFEVYASALARISPWQRIDGVICWVNPLRQVCSTPAPRGLWGVALVLLGTTAFDSLGSSLAWVRAVQSSAVPALAWGTVGLLAMIALVVALYWGACALLDRHARPEHTPLRSWHRLGPSLLPIVVGYVIAHYTTLFVLEGQRVLITLSDPLGRGQNWFGTAEWGVDASIFEHPSLVAWLQVAGIVIGHAVAVVAAHDLAVRWLPTERQMTAQVPILAVMVVFTCGGLLLLFAP